MSNENALRPGEPDPDPAPAEREITLEEWIASCQSCCGIEPEGWGEAQCESGGEQETKGSGAATDEHR